MASIGDKHSNININYNETDEEMLKLFFDIDSDDPDEKISNTLQKAESSAKEVLMNKKCLAPLLIINMMILTIVMTSTNK